MNLLHTFLLTPLTLITLFTLFTARTLAFISISQGISPPYYGQGPYTNMCSVGPGSNFQFHDRTSMGSPLIAHCLQLATYFRLQNNELFHVSDWGTGAYHRLWPNPKIAGVPNKLHLADAGNTCVVGVRFPEALDKVVMSGMDVADLLELSVSAFGRDGRVGSEGTLKCMSLKPIHEVNRWVDVEFGVFARDVKKGLWQ